MLRDLRYAPKGEKSVKGGKGIEEQVLFKISDKRTGSQHALGSSLRCGNMDPR
jgi:hypothetical protein